MNDVTALGMALFFIAASHYWQVRGDKLREVEEYRRSVAAYLTSLACSIGCVAFILTVS